MIRKGEKVSKQEIAIQIVYIANIGGLSPVLKYVMFSITNTHGVFLCFRHGANEAAKEIFWRLA